MRHTIRGIRSAVDTGAGQRARAGGKSLDRATIDALTDATGIGGKRHKRRDLTDIAGTWKTDKATESALADQDRCGRILSR